MGEYIKHKNLYYELVKKKKTLYSQVAIDLITQVLKNTHFKYIIWNKNKNDHTINKDLFFKVHEARISTYALVAFGLLHRFLLSICGKSAKHT